MRDQQITCVTCRRRFTWTAGEQRYYAGRGLQPPKRCPDCRKQRHAPHPTRGGKLASRWIGGALSLAIILTIGLWYIGMDIVLGWLIAITGITFLTYGYDKTVAGTKAMRVPEKALLVLAWVGGTLGAWAGMSFFRHKTAKESFQFKFVLLVIVQVTLVVTYFYLKSN